MNIPSVSHLIPPYHPKAKVFKAIEELGELRDQLLMAMGSNVVPLCRMLADPAVVDELADVAIMVAQLVELGNCEQAWQDRMRVKILRQEERIARGE